MPRVVEGPAAHASRRERSAWLRPRAQAVDSPRASSRALPPMDPIKAAKIKQRTFVGAGLAVGVAALLWLAAVDTQHLVVPLFGMLMAAGGAFELTRMDKLGGRDLRVPMIGGLFAVFLMQWATQLGDALGRSSPDRLGIEGWLASWATTAILTGLLLPLRRIPRGPFGLGRWIPAIAIIIGCFMALGQTSDGDLVLIAGAGLLVVAVALDALLSPKRSQGIGALAKEAALPIGLALWAIPALPALTYVDRWLGVAGLGALLLLSKIGDVFGYYVGSMIGKSHPFPNLSPGKTTAGCVGSLIAGCAFGAACVWWGLLPSADHGYLGGVVAGGVVNLASQAGDLLESKVKRTAGVKDSGALFGPSGGFLDLTDSLLLSVPVALAVWPLIFDATA
jgi:CDP-diglyceride synthetase